MSDHSICLLGNGKKERVLLKEDTKYSLQSSVLVVRRTGWADVSVAQMRRTTAILWTQNMVKQVT